ncbi:2-dehydro-3-deoxygalactonokinase [Pseudooceanicola sp. CBS1P-1]|uniref:2-keto-3-deoxy-galactonokinase n=1 Tax=Pseudooceanicola albus TaxID=2692189 RepID=A0A6L7G988_9RHOB|nr:MULTISPECIES: 2-dehydro-3-deoxygalactonokinase [Pseudooceanicola]MBT9382874.1 2-dehydro-3-deoxygalactonokinase [Pseudooceanicola endophyticus]MXN20202.1 2-keto-3-deoxy-galactonokinase [Pseudooceanicola albus]
MARLWIAADWGTSNLRLWVLGPEGTVLAERASDRGMGQLAPDQFEGALLDLCADLLPEKGRTQVLICGMAGAKQGWCEAPYAATPCAPAGLAPVTAPTQDPRLVVRILPGVAQAAPPDVMRGEETQIAGFLAGAPDFDGTLCLPGTHTKWVRVQGGQIRQFRTLMTGEVFALLSQASVLRHSLGGEGWDDSAFEAGLAAGLHAPEGLLGDLFAIRSATLLRGTAPDAARARLSGLLIGAELSGAAAFWQDLPVEIIGSPALSARYEEALRAAGARVRLATAPDLALAGLRAAHARLT